MLNLIRATKPAAAADAPAPEVGQAVNIDGYEGIITRVGNDDGTPSPFYDDPRPAVQIVGVTGEWSYWLHIDSLTFGRGGWQYRSAGRK